MRRQTLKLRFWGVRSGGVVLDLDCESIKSMPGSGVYELRLDDEIGGHRNIRVIFFDPPDDWVPLRPSPLPVIWILEALPKKRNAWVKFDIDRFHALRAAVKERLYQ